MLPLQRLMKKGMKAGLKFSDKMMQTEPIIPIMKEKAKVARAPNFY